LNNIGCYQWFNHYPNNVKWPFNCQQYKHTTVDPKMTFYGSTMVEIKMIVTGWRITIQLWVMTASLMN